MPAPGQGPPRAPPPKETHVSLYPGLRLGSALHDPPFPRKKLWKMSPLSLFPSTTGPTVCLHVGPGRCGQLGRAGQRGQGSAGSSNASGKKKKPEMAPSIFGVPEHRLRHLLENATAKCSPSSDQPFSPRPHPPGAQALPCPPSPPPAQSCPYQPAKTPTASGNGAETDPAPITQGHPHQPHPAPSCPATPQCQNPKGMTRRRGLQQQAHGGKHQLWTQGLNLILNGRTETGFMAIKPCVSLPTQAAFSLRPVEKAAGLQHR